MNCFFLISIWDRAAILNKYQQAFKRSNEMDQVKITGCVSNKSLGFLFGKAKAF